jgi:hypothetical protein
MMITFSKRKKWVSYSLSSRRRGSKGDWIFINTPNSDAHTEERLLEWIETQPDREFQLERTTTTVDTTVLKAQSHE